MSQFDPCICMILLKFNSNHSICLELFSDEQLFFQGGVFYPKQCLELPMNGDSNFRLL